MQILKKIIPYKIRRILPIAGIAAMGMALPSCDKDDEPVPIHDTVYTWGFKNFSDPKLKKNIRASADSASVRNIILKSDGKSWGGAYNENELRYLVIETYIQAGGEQNRHKFKGTGTIKDVFAKYPEDNKWLTDFGYTIIPLTESIQNNVQHQR